MYVYLCLILYHYMINIDLYMVQLLYIHDIIFAAPAF